MSKFIAVKVDGTKEVHALGAGGSDYATLCGLDGNDPEAGQEPATLPKNPKINCRSCKQILQMAWNYTKKDLGGGQ